MFSMKVGGRGDYQTYVVCHESRWEGRLPNIRCLPRKSVGGAITKHTLSATKVGGGAITKHTLSATKVGEGAITKHTFVYHESRWEVRAILDDLLLRNLPQQIIVYCILSMSFL